MIIYYLRRKLMKIYAKLISLLCACVMLLSVFAACAQPSDGAETTEDTAETVPAT